MFLGALLLSYLSFSVCITFLLALFLVYRFYIHDLVRTLIGMNKVWCLDNSVEVLNVGYHLLSFLFNPYVWI